MANQCVMIDEHTKERSMRLSLVSFLIANLPHEEKGYKLSSFYAVSLWSVSNIYGIERLAELCSSCHQSQIACLKIYIVQLIGIKTNDELTTMSYELSRWYMATIVSRLQRISGYFWQPFFALPKHISRRRLPHNDPNLVCEATTTKASQPKGTD